VPEATYNSPLRAWSAFPWTPVVAIAQVLKILASAPVVLFLLALTAMLFRPPELACSSLDRVAFVLMLVAFLLRSVLVRQPVRFERSAVWPLGALLVMSLASVATQPFEVKTWSVLAAKLIVPYALFHIARRSFRTESSRRALETFALLVLSYLCFIAVAFLFGARSLILPRFILDEGLSIHINRARGPFLQAVANGVTLNMLGLLALDTYRRRRIRGAFGAVLLVALPVAILATKTRAVWLSFLGSALIVILFNSNRRIRRVCLALVMTATFSAAVAFSATTLGSSLQDRFEDRSPVEIRLAVYHAAWDMFRERPLLGWGVSRMPSQLEERVSDFHLNQFVVHNTYLEILVEHGLLGLLLYGWLIVRLFRLARCRSTADLSGTFLDHGFRELWPVILGVYLLNGFFVVMNYQFVNGFLYTLAGLLAGKNDTKDRSNAPAN
jgi:O-antigen ligase